MSLLPALDDRGDAPALAFPDGALTYAQLAAAAAELGGRLPASGPVALWATPSLATAVGLLAALGGGLDVVPLNPRSGPGELAHILGETRPAALLAEPGIRVGELETISPRSATPRARRRA